MPIAVFPLGALETNSYFMYGGNQAIAVDVGGPPDAMIAWLAEHKIHLAAICATHVHFDHLYGVAALAEATGVPVYTPSGDDVLAGTEASKGGIWGFPLVPPFESSAVPSGKCAFAGMECEVLETPGHTPGGISLYFPGQRVVFTGDALFCRSIGRTDFPLGDHATLLRSIYEKLFVLPEDTKVFPGHGPTTTIGEEIRNNPFCGDFSQ
ncbi:MAG: MBL fold metallo-hydrolase [Desulfovibrio sp.]|jgi:glyoxylase-like metal-dependent hydrolase (beta-lactamase superfamily II)|nr:MBL fold metallo-hydrolase [Desulfovibrio sp.]